jgi:nicotinamidase/pyrazinamidase
MKQTDALIVVDLQNDFVPGGSLSVPQGDAIVPLVNVLMTRFKHVIATQDWHPSDHGSFAANHAGKNIGEIIQLEGLDQMLWPTHCVQNTHGAHFVPNLETHFFTQIVQKGTDKNVDSYSGFFDNGHRRATHLGDALKEQGITDVYVLGLATDYCVKFTTLDACQLGFKTFFIEDAIRGVERQPNDCAKAIQAMQSAGATVLHSSSLRL